MMPEWRARLNREIIACTRLAEISRNNRARETPSRPAEGFHNQAASRFEIENPFITAY
jgi:hypothetical protein